MAAVTPPRLRDLTEIALEIANHLARARGRSEPFQRTSRGKTQQRVEGWALSGSLTIGVVSNHLLRRQQWITPCRLTGSNRDRDHLALLSGRVWLVIGIAFGCFYNSICPLLWGHKSLLRQDRRLGRQPRTIWRRTGFWTPALPGSTCRFPRAAASHEVP
jgi:hypothetical protein